jgi:hypothetical protein
MSRIALKDAPAIAIPAPPPISRHIFCIECRRLVRRGEKFRLSVGGIYDASDMRLEGEHWPRCPIRTAQESAAISRTAPAKP